MFSLERNINSFYVPTLGNCHNIVYTRVDEEPESAVKRLSMKKQTFLSALAVLAIAICAWPSRNSRNTKAQAFGEGTQSGRTLNVTVIINEYSTEQDQQILLQSFNQSGMKGLLNALNKMKTKGHIAITETLGYDAIYIRVTNRLITFGEVQDCEKVQPYEAAAVRALPSLAAYNVCRTFF